MTHEQAKEYISSLAYQENFDHAIEIIIRADAEQIKKILNILDEK